MKANRIILYLLLGLACIGILSTCNSHERRKNEKVIKEKADSLRTVEKSYQSTLKKYKRVADSLQAKVSRTDSLLKDERRKLAIVKTELKKNLQSEWINISSEEKLERCDSLRIIVQEQEMIQASVDSLSGESLFTLTDLLIEKDEQIESCNESYQKVKDLLEETILECELKGKEVSRLEKKLKRKQFFSKVLGVGTMVLAGAVTSLIITAGN